MWYRTIVDRTKLISVSQPVLFSNLPFHRGSLPVTLSMSTCSSSLLVLLILSGRPRYLQGKSEMLHYTLYIIFLRMTHLHDGQS
jgi:hypothetical protein